MKKKEEKKEEAVSPEAIRTLVLSHDSGEDTFCFFSAVSALMVGMRLLLRTLQVVGAVCMAALLLLLFYCLSGPRGVDLRRGVPADTSLCVAMNDLTGRWPRVASSDLWKRLVSRKLLPAEAGPLQSFMGKEALSFYAPGPGLCAVSRITASQRGAEILYRLWKLATDGDWSRERCAGVDLLRIERRGDEPALTYFIWGDMALVLIGADPAPAREMAELVRGKGGWGAGKLAGFSPGHFISLYLRPRELMEYDLRGQYEEARERYGEEHLPACWKAVMELDAFLQENGLTSLFDLYSREASTIDAEEEILASLDTAGSNAVLEWRGLAKPPSPVAAPSLARYASLLPDSAIAAAAFLFQAPDVSPDGAGRFRIAPLDDDIRTAYGEKAAGLLSRLEGSAAVAAGRPSLFTALLPACAVFRLKSAADISGEVNGLLDVIAGRELVFTSPGFSASFESRAGHRRKEYGGREYFIMEKSGPFEWSYAQLDDMLVIATHRNLIKSIIRAAGEPGSGLSASRRFLHIAGPLEGEGESQGFLDLKEICSQASMALNLYALKEAFSSSSPRDEGDPFAPLRTAIDAAECVDSLAWEGGAGGGRIVIPMDSMVRSDTER